MTENDILREQGSKRGILFLQGGASGPYRPGPGFASRVNEEGSFTVKTGAGEQVFTYPATPGYFFEGYSYLNRDGLSYVVIRKVPEGEPHR